MRSRNPVMGCNRFAIQGGVEESSEDERLGARMLQSPAGRMPRATINREASAITREGNSLSFRCRPTKDGTLRINHHSWSNYRGTRPINDDAPGNYHRTPASYCYRPAINAEGFSAVFFEKAQNTADKTAVFCRKRVNTAEKLAVFFPESIDTEGLSAVICAG